MNPTAFAAGVSMLPTVPSSSSSTTPISTSKMILGYPDVRTVSTPAGYQTATMMFSLRSQHGGGGEQHAAAVSGHRLLYVVDRAQGPTSAAAMGTAAVAPRQQPGHLGRSA